MMIEQGDEGGCRVRMWVMKERDPLDGTAEPEDFPALWWLPVVPILKGVMTG